MATTCIPQAIGVPRLFQQPPTWPGIEARTGATPWPTTGAVQTSVPAGLDDPRWSGAFRAGYPTLTGGSEDAAFRAVHSDVGPDGLEALYLSWHVLTDNQFSPPIAGAPRDRLWVGFQLRSGVGFVLDVQPNFASPVNLAQQPAVVPYSFTSTAGSGLETAQPLPGSHPDWIKLNTHAWYDTGTRRWAVQLRVPISGDREQGLDLDPAAFRAWFETRVVLTVDATHPQPVNNHVWPRTAPLAEAPQTGNPRFPAIATWDTFRLSTGPGDPNCVPTNVVSLSRDDIGTDNEPSSQINLTSPNRFHARPLNGTGNTIPGGGVAAQFRIANWGSVFPTGTWDKVPASTGSNPAPNAAEILNGARGDLTFTWTLNATDRTPFQNGTRLRHQCMLVELSGPGLDFMPASVWRNMDFEQASVFEREAEISSVGLGTHPDGDPERDTYLYVERLNMPAPGRSPLPPPIELPEPPEPPEPEEPPVIGLGGFEEGGGGEGEVDPAEALEQAAAAALTNLQRLDLTMPVYRVHVYHDTGQTVPDGDQVLHVLTPGTSFGYYVRHEGDVLGFRDRLVGATRIGPNLYRLKVPVEGTARIRTRIEAVEPGPGGLLGWLLWLLAWLLRLLRALFRPIRAVIRWLRRHLPGGGS